MDEAISHYKRSISLNPHKSETYYNLGDALCLKGEFSKAVESYKGAIAHQKENAPAFYNMGNSYYMLG